MIKHGVTIATSLIVLLLSVSCTTNVCLAANQWQFLDKAINTRGIATVTSVSNSNGAITLGAGANMSMPLPVVSKKLYEIGAVCFNANATIENIFGVVPSVISSCLCSKTCESGNENLQSLITFSATAWDLVSVCGVCNTRDDK